ncbi:MAG: hypothetical protein FJZ96_00410 [Chloroflexi bacterium]|nr:hypothetical protein [Chloroflexota bacterium]
MADETIKTLMWDGIYAAKEGKKEEARRALGRAIELTHDHDSLADAWYWLSRVADDPAESRRCLENCLAHDLYYPEARRALAVLDGKLKPDEIVDPDALPAQPGGSQAAQADRFTCPKCGGRMAYSPDGRSLVCESCQRAETPSAGRDYAEQDFFLAMATARGHRQPVATTTFRCRGCGADFILPPKLISSTCAFCGSNHVVAVKQQRDLIAPDAIIPMEFDRRRAATLLVRWVEQNKIQPQGKVQAPHGIYLPVWTFDIEGEMPWSGQVYRDKQWVSISGTDTIHYNDLCIPACSEMADLLRPALPEFRYSSAPAYDPAYISGWPAEVYQVAMADAALEARRLVARDARQKIINHQGMVDNLKYSTAALHIASFKQALVPVWLTRYQAEQETYRVLINGQTGSIHGEKPKRGLAGWLENLVG